MDQVDTLQKSLVAAYSDTAIRFTGGSKEGLEGGVDLDAEVLVVLEEGALTDGADEHVVLDRLDLLILTEGLQDD